MPVAIAPVDGEPRPAFGELAGECGDQGTVLVVDGGFSVEMIVVLGDLEQTLARGVPAAEDVLEEWDYVFAAFGTTERDQQKRVVGCSIAHLLQCSRSTISDDEPEILRVLTTKRRASRRVSTRQAESLRHDASRKPSRSGYRCGSRGR